jgi:hypothetical protein
MDLHGREGRATAPGTIAFHEPERERERRAKGRRGKETEGPVVERK